MESKSKIINKLWKGLFYSRISPPTCGRKR